MNQIKIGKFIAECRKKNNLTQMQLAKKLNITDRAISKWENGRGMPDLSLMKPLCDELGITINELISGEVLDKKLTSFRISRFKKMDIMSSMNSFISKDNNKKKKSLKIRLSLFPMSRE